MPPAKKQATKKVVSRVRDKGTGVTVEFPLDEDHYFTSLVTTPLGHHGVGEEEQAQVERPTSTSSTGRSCPSTQPPTSTSSSPAPGRLRPLGSSRPSRRSTPRRPAPQPSPWAMVR